MSLDDLSRQMGDLSLKYTKHKTADHVRTDIQKVTGFLKSTCTSKVYDTAFTTFVDLNMKNVSSNCLSECIRLLQKENARRVNQPKKDEYDDYL